MEKYFNFNDLAREARRALDEERECLTEMARKVESYDRLLDAGKQLAAENEELKDQLQEMTTKLNEMSKLVAGVAKKTSEDDVIKFIRVFVNKSKQKTAKKRTKSLRRTFLPPRQKQALYGALKRAVKIL